jgi:hypothetical protein
MLFSSSPEMLKDNFRSVPLKFGNEQPSACWVRVFADSSTVYVPNKAKLPFTAALFSSGVLSSRFLDANLGISERRHQRLDLGVAKLCTIARSSAGSTGFDI